MNKILLAFVSTYFFLFFQFHTHCCGADVRVLLGEDKGSKKAAWVVSCKDGMVLFDPKTPWKKLRSKGHQVKIDVVKGSLYINGKRFLKNEVQIVPFAGHLDFEGNSYDGVFHLTVGASGAFLVNVLNLEDYVFSVLRSEGWPTWPLEVNKVLAIAVRSYVLSKISEARPGKKSYHIKNTNHHQTYNGKHSVNGLRQAVDETRYIFWAITICRYQRCLIFVVVG